MSTPRDDHQLLPLAMGQVFRLLILVAIAFFLQFPDKDNVASRGAPTQKMDLRDVQTLTFVNGKMTTGRRLKELPQVQCIGGSAGCDAFVPATIQCYNRGSDGDRIQWECRTEMPSLYTFGNVQIDCEGFSSPDDHEVLKGSCALKYTLEHAKSQGRNGTQGVSTAFSSKGSAFDSVIRFAVEFNKLIVALLLTLEFVKTCIKLSMMFYNYMKGEIEVTDPAPTQIQHQMPTPKTVIELLHKNSDGVSGSEAQGGASPSTRTVSGYGTTSAR